MSKKVVMPSDLYDCYLLHEEARKKSMLSLSSAKSKKNRSFIFERLKPLSRAKFEVRLKELDAKTRAEAERRFRTPYKELIREGMREVRRALREFETDPKVRERVAKEAEEVLERAKKRR